MSTELDTRVQLGRLVKDRRVAQQLSASEAARRAGVSRMTWTRLERGAVDMYDHTHPKIEGALGWAPGSIAAVLSGGEPTVVSEHDESVINADGVEIADILDQVERVRGLSPDGRAAILALLHGAQDRLERDTGAGDNSREGEQRRRIG